MNPLLTEGRPRRLIIGISGASGAIYGVRLLQLLQGTPIETHLVVSKSALITLQHETGLSWAQLKGMASVCHSSQDIGACISSGSFKTMGMVIAPCSVRSMSEIASGVTSSLLTRAADVVLKEQRRLVLMIRETPLHRNHLRHLMELAELGAVIAPPVPAFYARPQNLEEMVDHTLGRVLDMFDIELGVVRRWREAPPEPLPSRTGVASIG